MQWASFTPLRYLKLIFTVIGWSTSLGKTKPQHCIRNKLCNRLKVILNSCAISLIRIFVSIFYPLENCDCWINGFIEFVAKAYQSTSIPACCSAHFSSNPKRIGPNNISSIFAWAKLTPRTTKGGSPLSSQSNDDDTAKTVATGQSTNVVSEEDSAVVDVSSEPAYHLNLLADTALKESSSGSQAGSRTSWIPLMYRRFKILNI